MSEIFVPRNPIEVAQELQWGIDMALHPEVADEIAQHAIELIGDVHEIYGTHKLIIHGITAYSINRKLTFDEQINKYDFNEMIVRGHFGGLPFVKRSNPEPALKTFMADIYDVEILEPYLDNPEERFIKVPVLFPVLSIQSVMVAA